MKKYKVYIEYPYVSCEPEEEILEFPDDTPQEEIDKECAFCLDIMIGNMDTGWYELEDGEE